MLPVAIIVASIALLLAVAILAGSLRVTYERGVAAGYIAREHELHVEVAELEAQADAPTVPIPVEHNGARIRGSHTRR